MTVLFVIYISWGLFNVWLVLRCRYLQGEVWRLQKELADAELKLDIQEHK